MNIKDNTENGNDTGRETADGYAPFTLSISHLFLAFPMSSFFILTALPNKGMDQSLSLVLMRILIPTLIVCMLALLIIAFTAYRRPRIVETPLILPCVILIISGGILYTLRIYGILDQRFLIPLSVMIIGLGGAFLLLLWLKAYSLLKPAEVLPHASLSLCLAASVIILIDLIPLFHVKMIIITASLVLSAIPLERIFLINNEENESWQAKVSKPWSTFGLIWKPFFGIILCLMIFGCSWGTSLSKGGFDGTGLGDGAQTLCQLFAGVLLFALSWFSLKAKSPLRLTRLIEYVPVTAAALLLLSWFFALIDQTPLLIVSRSLMGLSSGLLVLLFWDALLKAIALNKGHAFVSGGFYIGAAIGIMLVCIGGAYYLQDAAEFVTPICILVYLTLVNFNFGKTETSSDLPKLIDEDNDESLLNMHCAKVGKTYGLSPRECELLPYLARGHSAIYIAQVRCISLNTVKTHTRRTYNKLGVHSRDELIELVDSMEDSQD